MRLEKYEAAKMRAYLEERMTKLPRCKSKMYKFMSHWYFKEMSQEEYESKRDVIYQEVNGIHTDKQLSDFMCKVQGERVPFDNV